MKKIAITLMALIATLLFSGCADAGGTDAEGGAPVYITGDEIQTENGGGTETEDEENDNTKDLMIPISELTASAKFFGITVDGTYMEVIAFKSGTAYRTAFNTCQVCYGSRTAYYKQSGNYLVCQNCGSKFALSNVGVKAASYTCSPYPILETDRTTDGEYIIVSYGFLVKAKTLFRTWKVV